VKAASVILYHLGGRCSAFTADVGVDDEAGGKASVVFKVEADGELLWVTDVKLAGDPATRVAVDLTGKRELKLVVTPASDSTSDDHADWADARLFCR
jgi:hypothetical protein